MKYILMLFFLVFAFNTQAENPRCNNITWDSIAEINAPSRADDNTWFNKPVGTYYAIVNGEKISLTSQASDKENHVGFSWQCERDKNAPHCSIIVHTASIDEYCECEGGSCRIDSRHKELKGVVENTVVIMNDVNASSCLNKSCDQPNVITWDSITEINAPSSADDNTWVNKPIGTFYAIVNGKKIPRTPPASNKEDHVGFSWQCERDKNAPGCSISIHTVSPFEEYVCENGKCKLIER